MPDVKVIELQAQHGRFELVLNNPNAKRLTIFLLGDRKRGFLPPRDMLDNFTRTLTTALASTEDRVVVMHPMVSVLQVDLPAGPLVVTSPVLDGHVVKAETLEDAASDVLKPIEGVPAEVRLVLSSWLKLRAKALRGVS